MIRRALPWLIALVAILIASTARAEPVYVNAAGDDARDGLTPATAVATPERAAAILWADPGVDAVLLRRGDVYRLDRHLTWQRGDTRLGAWGDGPPPVLDRGGSGSIIICRDNRVNNVTIEDVHLRNGSSWAVIAEYRGADFKTNPIRNWTMRRCVFSDFSGTRAGGPFLYGVDGFTIADCLFIRAGGDGSNLWPEAHPVYGTGDSRNVTIERCVFLDSTDGGQPRGLGTIYRDNVVIGCYIGFDGYGGTNLTTVTAAGGTNSIIERNLIIAPLKWGLRLNNFTEGSIKDNIIAHPRDTSAKTYAVYQERGAQIAANVTDNIAAGFNQPLPPGFTAGNLDLGPWTLDAAAWMARWGEGPHTATGLRAMLLPAEEPSTPENPDLVAQIAELRAITAAIQAELANVNAKLKAISEAAQ